MPLSPLSPLAGLLSLVLLAPTFSAPRPQGADTGKAPQHYKLASRIKDEIVLEDLEGRKVRLFERSFHEEEGKLITLVFWSLRDPQSRRYRKRLEKYAARYEPKGVSLYLVASSFDEIFSGRGDAIEKFRAFVKKEKFTLPILIDHGNVIADDFGALVSSHSFIIDRQRYVRYIGAIDDDPKEKHPDTVRHLLHDATEALLTGKKIKDPLSRPTGRKIKRAPKRG